MSEIIIAAQALTEDGWRNNVAITIEGGRVEAIEPSDAPPTVDILLPAPGNLHSHAFQRAMAGLTEQQTGNDNFWSWRALMYRFLEALTPDDVEVIASGLMMEMLEAGYAALGEFHYLHNAPGGTPYDNPAELAARIAAAAGTTGMGLTLLPVLYMQGGLDGRALEGGQRRFASTEDSFAALMEGAAQAIAGLPDDTRLGVAPHSLRAVPADAIARVAARPGPKHIHVAEQTAEVEEVLAHTGARPMAHLASLVDLSPEWTLIHCTHGTAAELGEAARAGAVAGLCPITESNLGDGIIEMAAVQEAGGRFGIGSDSNVRISLAEELRTLDYSQRLARRARNPLAGPGQSSGRTLYQGACLGAAQALARGAGTIAPGNLADLVALDGAAPSLAGLTGDRVLDAHIFAGDDGAVRDVWSAGRHVVRGGRHVARDRIAPAFMATLRRLRTVA
ncbi:formimidoylglutamate deiminase [Acuticoccus sp. MNP-M23]|uniref:formimidoylglutamate deiminase n=1 Tax=Acuticoccus sp. MNP-M23 TaxID=3072793 RepID=UPI0028168759|nr:formimidoylglutamate deiminase [Acuticoccus sp. MNP-M23]WMS44345.1 formimidoylglutamate deiminase [Acuticoccus sp. MNP-M23]